MKGKIIELKIGDRVRTIKGCRIKGQSSGVIVGWSKFVNENAANIKKDNGQTRQFLIKNLVKA